MESNSQYIASSHPTGMQEAPRVRYDRPRLKADIALQTAGIRKTKAILRQPHTPETGPVQVRLLEQKHEATILCSIAAHVHGRVHLDGNESPEEQEERIRVALVAYTRPVVQE